MENHALSVTHPSASSDSDVFFLLILGYSTTLPAVDSGSHVTSALSGNAADSVSQTVCVSGGTVLPTLHFTTSSTAHKARRNVCFLTLLKQL